MSELLTISEVAAILNVGEDTVARRFSKVKGVIDLGSPETPKKRRYRLLRIPRTIVEKFLLSRGGSVPIEPPPKPARKSKQTVMSEDEVVQQLAKLVTQNGTEARKTMARIAERARLLKFVPEERWQDVVWVSDEDEG
jgi:hypothetical protein